MESTLWTPSENPNPFEILHSAVDDTRDGKYELALAKFLWFHNNAVQYERGLSAVRLSFALGYWLDLAMVYSPARDAFIRTRDETERAFRKDASDFNMFHDIASMNGRLGDETRTAELFGRVAITDQANARRLYRVAERNLIAAGEYRACAPFLDPKRRVELAAECYHLSKQHEESSPERGVSVPKLARTHFIHDVATLVGLLVLNDQVDNARNAYNVALTTIDDEEFRTVMNAAMSGHLPERRPR